MEGDSRLLPCNAVLRVVYVVVLVYNVVVAVRSDYHRANHAYTLGVDVRPVKAILLASVRA